MNHSKIISAVLVFLIVVCPASILSQSKCNVVLQITTAWHMSSCLIVFNLTHPQYRNMTIHVAAFANGNITLDCTLGSSIPFWYFTVDGCKKYRCEDINGCCPSLPFDGQFLANNCSPKVLEIFNSSSDVTNNSLVYICCHFQIPQELMDTPFCTNITFSVEGIYMYIMNS